MSADRLAEIRARADNATPGPWHGDHDEFGCVHIGDYGWVASGPQGQSPEYDVDTMQGRTDAEFIAHARTDVPWLLDEVERLRADLSRLDESHARQAAALARVRELVADTGNTSTGPTYALCADVLAAIEGTDS